MSGTAEPLALEFETFEAEKTDLEKHHNGKWVVIHGKEIVGTFDNFQNAADEAVRRFGKGPYLIRQIGAPPATLPASVVYRPVRADADN